MRNDGPPMSGPATPGCRWRRRHPAPQRGGVGVDRGQPGHLRRVSGRRRRRPQRRAQPSTRPPAPGRRSPLVRRRAPAGARSPAMGWDRVGGAVPGSGLAYHPSGDRWSPSPRTRRRRSRHRRGDRLVRSAAPGRAHRAPCPADDVVDGEAAADDSEAPPSAWITTRTATGGSGPGRAAQRRTYQPPSGPARTCSSGGSPKSPASPTARPTAR